MHRSRFQSRHCRRRSERLHRNAAPENDTAILRRNTIPHDEHVPRHDTATRYRSTNAILQHEHVTSTQHRESHSSIVAAFETGNDMRDTTMANKASFVLSVASLPSTIGEIVGFTLSADACEQGLFTIYTLSNSMGIGNQVAAENRMFQHQTAISTLIMCSAQVSLYARGTL